MSREILLLVLGLFAVSLTHKCSGQQPSTTVYIEQNPDLTKQLENALQNQYSGDADGAICAYQKILGTKAKEVVIPFYYPDISYILSLEKAIEDWEGSAAPSGYSDLFARSQILLTAQQWEKLRAAYRQEGLPAIWKEVSSWMASGLYVGAEECVRQNMATITPESLSISQRAELKRAEHSYMEALRTGDVENVYHCLSEHPSCALKGWITLGDVYFAQGEVSRALGIWYRVVYWNYSMSHAERCRLMARIALASWIIGDRVVYRRIQEQYEKESTTIEVMGKQRPMAKFLVEIPSLLSKSETNEVWSNWGGNESHNLLPPSLEVGKKLSPLPNYEFPCLSREVLPQPQFWQGKLFYNLPDNPFCLLLKDARLCWSRRFNQVGAMDRHVGAGVVHKDCFYFISFPTSTSPYFNPDEGYANFGNTLYCLEAGTGRTLWQWPAEGEEREIIFSSPPVIVGDKLFVGGTILTGQINAELFCFQIAPGIQLPGELLWRRFICAQMVSGYSKNVPIRSGNGLCAGYGMVYYCTNLGVIAAVDAEDGEIRWLADYHQTPQKYRLRGARHNWENTPPVVRHGRLYVTPADAECLYIYDALDGALQRTFPDSRGNECWSHLVGVGEDGTIFLAGPNEITALKNEGAEEILWRSELSESLRGIAILSAEWIYVPTEGGIWQIAIKTGEAEKIIATKTSREMEAWKAPGLPVVQATPISVLPVMVDNSTYLVVTGITDSSPTPRTFVSIYKQK